MYSCIKGVCLAAVTCVFVRLSLQTAHIAPSTLASCYLGGGSNLRSNQLLLINDFSWQLFVSLLGIVLLAVHVVMLGLSSVISRENGLNNYCYMASNLLSGCTGVNGLC